MVSVKVENATKLFGDVKAVDDVTINVEKGELFFLLGPSGCGKTTILRIIAGFYLPDSGKIFFDGADITLVPPHKRNTGMVFQNYALWPHMTVWENVEYGLNLRKISASEKRVKVEKALSIVQMSDYAQRSPNQLSGGQQQRIALARALVIEPDVVLLDEPLSNLDAKLRIEMREEIKRIHSQVGTTMIYVTHDQKEALSMADRIAILDSGRVVQIGDPRAVYSHPADRFVAGFIGETNFLDGEISSVEGEIVVETKVGRIISHTANDGFKVNDVVTCSIRPESISIDTAGQTKPNNISAKIERIMYLGDVEQYFLSLSDGTSFKVTEHNPKFQKARVGDTVGLSFEPDNVVVLI